MGFILPREYKFYYTPSRDIITTEFHYSSHDILSAPIYYNVVTAPPPSGLRKLCHPRAASTFGQQQPSGGIMHPSGA